MARRVLVVADDVLALELVRTVLELEGMDVHVSTGGRNALERLRREPPDLVVCETALPDLDGVEVCRRVKGDPATARIPVLLLCADRDEDLRAAQAAGSDAYLTTPFSPATLLDVVAGCGAVDDGRGPRTAAAT